MEERNSKYGLNSLLQALAILGDTEEFRTKYTSVPETIKSRRETTVTLLCDIIRRMKRDLEAKNKCCELLQQVSEGWSLLLLDGHLKNKRITDLEKERADLLEKVKNLEEALQGNRKEEERNKRHENGQRLDPEISDGISLTKYDPSFRNMETSSTSGQSAGKPHVLISTDGNNDDTNNFEPSNSVNLNEREAGCSTQVKLEPSPSDDSFTLLTSNPYEQLNSIYYNPTQFYERQSSTFRQASTSKGRGSRGRGSRNKTNNVPSQQTSSKQRNGKSQGRGKKNKDSDGGGREVITSKGAMDVESVATTTNDTTQGQDDPSRGCEMTKMHEGGQDERSGPFEQCDDPTYLDLPQP